MCILVAGWWGIVECKIDFWFLFHTSYRVYCVLTESELHVRKLVKVGGVVYGSDSDGDGGRTLPDVVPVHVGEPVQLLHVLYVLNSLVSTFTQSETGN